MSGRGRQGQEAGLSVAQDDLWVPLSQEEECVVQVVMSAKRLEEGLGLPAGELPQSLVDGKDLVLAVVSAISSLTCSLLASILLVTIVGLQFVKRSSMTSVLLIGRWQRKSSVFDSKLTLRPKSLCVHMT